MALALSVLGPSPLIREASSEAARAALGPGSRSSACGTARDGKAAAGSSGQRTWHALPQLKLCSCQQTARLTCSLRDSTSFVSSRSFSRRAVSLETRLRPADIGGAKHSKKEWQSKRERERERAMVGVHAGRDKGRRANGRSVTGSSNLSVAPTRAGGAGCRLPSPHAAAARRCPPCLRRGTAASP